MDTTGELSDDIRSHVESNSRWAVNGGNTDEVVDALRGEFKEVHSELESEHRWWDDWLHVVEVGGRLIGYPMGRANRDEGIDELGYVLDLSSICFMEAYEVTTTKYRHIK